MLYDEEDGMLRLNWKKDREKNPNMMNNMESLFIQYLNLHVFPDALYVCSAFTAGLGQVTFGCEARQKADCLIVGSEERRAGGVVVETRRVLRYFNFHGMIFHGTGLHRPDCPKKPNQNEDKERARDGEQGLSDSVKRACMRQRGRAQAASSEIAGSPPPWLAEEVKWRDDQDELKVDYAAALTAVDPSRLAVRFDVAHECDFFHTQKFPGPEELRGAPVAGERGTWSAPSFLPAKNWKAAEPKGRPNTVRKLLKAVYPTESVLGVGRREFSQQSLVKCILSSGYNSVQGNGFGGFVTITGGEETRTDDGTILRQFGMCHQRCRRDIDNLGAFSRFQARLKIGSREGGDAWLKKLVAGKSTMSRNSFHQEGETISLDYFRFLVNERGLKGYRIRHFISYQHRQFLTPFVQDMLQKRHDARKKTGDELMSQVLKLVLNGLYGEFGAVCSFYLFFSTASSLARQVFHQSKVPTFRGLELSPSLTWPNRRAQRED